MLRGLVLAICFNRFAISGVIMWQASRLPPELVRWMYIVHDLAMVMVVPVIRVSVMGTTLSGEWG